MRQNNNRIYDENKQQIFSAVPEFKDKMKYEKYKKQNCSR